MRRSIPPQPSCTEARGHCFSIDRPGTDRKSIQPEVYHAPRRHHVHIDSRRLPPPRCSRLCDGSRPARGRQFPADAAAAVAGPAATGQRVRWGGEIIRSNARKRDLLRDPLARTLCRRAPEPPATTRRPLPRLQSRASSIRLLRQGPCDITSLAHLTATSGTRWRVRLHLRQGRRRRVYMWPKRVAYPAATTIRSGAHATAIVLGSRLGARLARCGGFGWGGGYGIGRS